jgi:uncharacterized protein YjiS (DUF1127 family)
VAEVMQPTHFCIAASRLVGILQPYYLLHREAESPRYPQFAKGIPPWPPSKRAARHRSAPSRRTRTVNAFTNALATFKVWNDTRITRKALSKLSDRELDDIGLCRGDIEMLGR